MVRDLIHLLALLASECLHAPNSCSTINDLEWVRSKAILPMVIAAYEPVISRKQVWDAGRVKPYEAIIADSDRS